MNKVLIGCCCALALGCELAWAESMAQSDQILACQQKVTQLSEQTRPLKSKLTTLRNERKGISASSGEVARFKLSNLDQEISQITKQIDGINAQVATENRHCDELAGKPKSAAQTPAATSPAPSTGKQKKSQHR